MFHMDVFHSRQPSRQVTSYQRHERRPGQINCDHSGFKSQSHILPNQVLFGGLKPLHTNTGVCSYSGELRAVLKSKLGGAMVELREVTGLHEPIRIIKV